ncbi:MAG TPA: sulfite exporter TauE/SafE family protein [Cyclobacteriaceae bacterium]|nr:sulfite exporter TauE/SafE family protein [Cyclobacteriaceae bacterium]
MEIIGFVASVLMGLSLGLIGGGGSILTVPILVYLFGINPVVSTSYSLFVVGLTSLIGSYSHFRAGNLDGKTAAIFGIPSIVAVYLTRKFGVPMIPDPVFSLGSMPITKDGFILLLFALIMILAAFSMIRKTKREVVDCKQPIRYNVPLIIGEGVLVGAITGLVGAGGGFLIIPALVLLGGLCMKKAVGTSLLIIALKSLIGFTGDLSSGLELDFTFMLLFAGFAALGIVGGTLLSRTVPNEKLKPAFGWFVLVMGVFIISEEMLLTI